MNDDHSGKPPNSDADPTRSLSSGSAPHGRIGPYTLVHKLGEGGMGEVWLAEQKAPVRRRVALKLIKRGMDSARVIARFEAERQALALMSHPNIAQVIDAGTTGDGRLYFVMENVEGVPITEHCDRHRLTTRQRLELFLEVCEGLQHAHQKGIIHRDIKPSNVLVAVRGDRRVPKLIDFGVAKATAQRLTERTVFTELGQLIGTPEYMSPEQAEMTAEDVDTRSDIYSLGVLLYELLVGALPFGSKELRSGGFDELRRKIREDEPVRPSTKIGTLGDSAQFSAEARSTDPRSLRRRLREDLDWITMKAMAKDRTGRYGSASEFAADIRRHLKHEPVTAGPPSVTYRAGRFVRRHRIGVAIAAVALVVLTGAAWREIVQARRVERERDEAVWRGYVASVQAAVNALEDGRVQLARDRLAECPSELRGWEWSMVQGTLPPPPRRLNLGFVKIQALRPTDDGSRLQVLYQQYRSTLLGELDLQSPDADEDWTERDVLVVPWDPTMVVYWNRHAMNSSGSIAARCDLATDRLQVMNLENEADDALLWSYPIRCLDLAFVGQTGLLAVREGHATPPPPQGRRSRTIVFDVASGDVVNELPAGDLAGASESPILAILDGKTIALHELGSGGTVNRVPLPLEGAETFILTPRAERALLGYDDGLLLQVDLAKGEITRLRTETQGRITALAATDGGRTVAFGTSEGVVSVIEDGSPARLVTRHGSGIRALAFERQGGGIFSADEEGTVAHVPLASSGTSGLRRSLRGISLPSEAVRIRFGRGGELAAVVTWGEQGLMLLDGRSLRIVEHLYPEGSGLRTQSWLFWSADGRRLGAFPLWATDDEPMGLRIWELDERGRAERSFFQPKEDKSVQLLLGATSDARSWLMTTVDSGIAMEEREGQTVRTLWEVSPEALAGRPSAGALPDERRGRWIVGLVDDGLIALDAQDGSISGRVSLDGGSARPLALHPSGEYLLAALRGRELGFVDAETLQLLETVPYGDRRLAEARFTPDGSRFVVGFADGTIEVWSSERRQPIVALKGPADSKLWSLDVTGDGRLLVAVDGELVAFGPWSVEP